MEIVVVVYTQELSSERVQENAQIATEETHWFMYSRFRRSLTVEQTLPLFNVSRLQEPIMVKGRLEGRTVQFSTRTGETR